MEKKKQQSVRTYSSFPIMHKLPKSLSVFTQSQENRLLSDIRTLK